MDRKVLREDSDIPEGAQAETGRSYWETPRSCLPISQSPQHPKENSRKQHDALPQVTFGMT